MNRRPTEAACQRTIVEAAKRGGWRVHATPPAQRANGNWVTPVQGDAGWPDLILLRNGELLIRELKRRPYTVKPEQQAWLDGLRAAGVDADVLWVPEQQDAFIARLMARPRKESHDRAIQ